jgi:two-component system heavy metal sensor histidine kinase CusS
VGEDLEGPRQLFVRVFGPASIGVHETVRFPAEMTTERFLKAGGAPAPTLRQIPITLGGKRFLGATQTVSLPARLGGGDAVILMALDTSADAGVVDRYTVLIIIIAVLGVILSIPAGRMMIRWQLRPLSLLAEQASAIDKSTLSRRIAIDHLPAEMRGFVDQFNAMVGRLERDYNSLLRYSDDVAHELRSPLNRIQLGAEVALADPQGSPEAYREALESTFSECLHLSKVVRGLLFIASAEHGSTAIALEPFDLGAGLARILAVFEDSAADSGIILQLACDAAMTMRGDATLVQRAVFNLVSNALAHTPRGGQVSIAARHDGEDVVIQVADTGEGIAKDDVPHVFDRFFHRGSKPDGDRTRLGLGLAITKSIMDLHGGQVRVESERGAGATFTLLFPQTIFRNAA